MQSLIAQKPFYGGGLYGASPAMRKVSQPTTNQRLATPHKDQVLFGKIENLTGPIPPDSVVVVVPGISSPAQSVQPLANYFRARGHTVQVLKSPFNIKAGSALASTNWLTHGIDRIRLEQASARYMALFNKVRQEPIENKLDFLCQELRLKKDTLGQTTAQAALELMFTPESSYEEASDFTRIIQRLRQDRQDLENGLLPDEDAHKRLYSLSIIARNKLHEQLQPVFMRVPTGFTDADFKAKDAALRKTIDHVMDQIAPRVVLVGHSMGGFVSMLTLFEQMRDTAMVVALSAPGENGTDVIPTGLGILKQLPDMLQQQGRRLLESLAPGFRHMVSGSDETDKLKADHQPFNTTLIAVGTPGNHDGLVGQENSSLNDSLPGRMNVIVTPRLANLAAVGSQVLAQLNQLAFDHLPFYGKVGNALQAHEPFKGIAYHCGLMQFPEAYWSERGDILRGIFEVPKDEEGRMDYKHGKPDYPAAIGQIRRLIDPMNYDAERLHILNILQDTLQDAQQEKPAAETQKLLNAYQPLRDDLERISREMQPVRHGVADKARQLLRMLPKPEEPETQ